MSGRMRMLGSRVRGMFTGRERDRELDDEVRFHLDMLVEEHARRGLSPDEARRAALRHFGGVIQIKEEYRDQCGLPALEMAAQDVRYGLRTLLRTPAFTFAALVTLTLGIGANSAIFSVVNAVLLRPLPYADVDRLGHLVWRTPQGDYPIHDGRRYLYFRERMRSVEALAAYSGAGSFNLVNGDRAEFVGGLYVSKEYFTAFGIEPLAGRGFTAEEDADGGPAVVILSPTLWQRQFGGDRDVVGRSILLGDRAFTVVGIMPEAFEPPGGRPDVYLPLRPGRTGRGSGSNYSVVVKLNTGVTFEQASAEAASIFTAFAAEVGQEVGTSRYGVIPLQQSMASAVRPALLMMLGAVGLLLLIACANTAGLLLARASGRGREIAVRAALGASRSRIVRQLLTESLLLAIVGALLGLVLAYWAVPALVSFTPPGFLIIEDAAIDATVLLVTMLVAVVTGLVFGLAPALSLSRHDLVAAFKDDGGRTTTGRRAGLLRQGLVVGEVALCMLLLVSAGLLIQTFVRLRTTELGFDPTGVLTARMSLQGERYAKPEDLNRFYDEGLERIRRIPGVRSAAVVNGIPIERALNLNVDVLDGPVRIEDALTDWRYTTADYFTTMGIPLVAGRGFTEADRAGAPRVAVVSEEFQRRFFEGQSAIGRHIRVFEADGWMEIVGIVKDLKEGGLKGLPLPVMYVPVAQTHEAAIRTTHSYFQVSWIIRADNQGAALVRQIEEAMRGLDPRQPFSMFRTMDDVKTRATATERFQMIILAVFAGIGLVLSAAGIYGLLAYSVSQRTREIGIRAALGASRAHIVRSVIERGARLAALGVTLGAAGALALGRTLRGFVWGVGTGDPATYLAVAGVLVSVALLASLVPAMRALRLDPVRALRE